MDLLIFARFLRGTHSAVEKVGGGGGEEDEMMWEESKINRSVPSETQIHIHINSLL